MATKPPPWPEISYKEWPANQSTPAKDRDDAAMNAARVSQLARTGFALVRRGEHTQAELLYLFGRIDALTADILRLMERNGAPTRPYPNGNGS